MFLRWILFAPVSLIFNILVMLTSPVWALWAAIGKMKTLPGIFSHVHTHDDWIYGHGWPKPDVPEDFFDRFKIALWWLCRNPGYTFDAEVLGFKDEGMVVLKDETKGKFDSGEPAKRYTVMQTGNGKKYFSYRRDFKLGKGKFCKFWAGWQPTNQSGWHIIKVDLNPFKKAK